MVFNQFSHEERRDIKSGLLEKIFQTNELRETSAEKTNSASSVQEKSSLAKDWHKYASKQLALTDFYETVYREFFLETNSEYLEAEISQIEDLLDKMPSTRVKNSDYMKGILNFGE